MENKRPYQPVGCDFVDLIEINASHKKLVQLIYYNNKGDETQVKTQLVTWETRNKIEYLITSDPLEIRLDDIISIDGQTDEKQCNV